MPNGHTDAFRTIQSPRVQDGWDVEDAPLAIHRDSILFVMETKDAPPLPSNRAATLDAARHTRAALRLRMGEFVLEGFVHVPPGGTPLSRLFHDRHAFMAFTSVTVTGPNGTVEAPFVAVNRAHVSSAQEVAREAVEGGREDRRDDHETDKLSDAEQATG